MHVFFLMKCPYVIFLIIYIFFILINYFDIYIYIYTYIYIYIYPKIRKNMLLILIKFTKYKNRDYIQNFEFYENQQFFFILQM